MAERARSASGLTGRLPGALALAFATALWVAAAWLGFYRPDLIAPFGPHARFAVLAIAWLVPVFLTLSAWIALRRARRALAEARALRDETDAMSRSLKKARAAVGRNAAAPPAPQSRDRRPEKAASADAPAQAQAGSAPSATDAKVADLAHADEAKAKPEKVAAPKPATASAARTPGTPAPELSHDETVAREALWAALDFPRSQADEAGFAALRRALADNPKLGAVIRTSQHVLSLLSQEGVHLDADSAAPPPEPQLWRLYAEGARGAAVAELGRIEDREALALTVGRLRRDPAFRSAAHRFVAAFDAWLAEFVPDAENAALTRMAASRSARAFRILGRATGSFG